MRLIIRWSPISSVFSIEPEGITRAWPIVPLISRNTSATQNHAMISCWTRCPTGTLACTSLFFLASAFMFHRHRPFACAVFLEIRLPRVGSLSVGAAFSHFQLHQVRGIHAGIARGAVVALGIVHRPLESGEGNVAERIRSDEFANLFRRARGGDQLFPRRRIHSVI